MAAARGVLDRGEPIRGPSAIGGDLRRTATLTIVIARTDFKLRFFGSVLGYVWQLMRPLMLFGVLYFVFTQLIHVANLPFYGVALLLGIVLFTFFSEATGGAVTCVMGRENLVRKIQFPRMVIPMSVVLTACFNLALNLVVVFIFASISGLTPRWTWLALLPLVLLLVAFASGLAMMLSALYVRYRDIQPIWEVFLQALFYGSLIIVPFETVVQQGHTQIAHILLADPLAAIVQEARNLVVGSAYVAAPRAIGGAGWLLVPIAIIVGTCVVGWRVFNREAPRIAEEL
ncbi:MAG: type transport system permease protein [Solirubrobacteraceae bacterium]|jgi:ABC-2 type transport system permease protein|nr:type transport system permease protein [Solirubrobacteraceae bacterium]